MPRDQRVGEVMTTDVLQFTPDEPVLEAIRLLVERDVDGGPVVDAEGKVVGMLSNADLILRESELHPPTVLSLFGAYLEWPGSARRFEDDFNKALGSKVSEAMHAKAVTIGEDDTLERAATVMHDKDVSRLPVVRDGRLVGIIGRNDILRSILDDWAAGEHSGPG
jgi:CBS domain-containing protein